jgi:hypothetical protein
MRWLVLPAAALVVACTSVKFNDGEKVTIEHEPGWPLVELTKSAVSACRQAGKTDANYVRTLSTNPELPNWMVPQLSTFECK